MNITSLTPLKKASLTPPLKKPEKISHPDYVLESKVSYHYGTPAFRRAIIPVNPEKLINENASLKQRLASAVSKHTSKGIGYSAAGGSGMGWLSAMSVAGAVTFTVLAATGVIDLGLGVGLAVASASIIPVLTVGAVVAGLSLALGAGIACLSAMGAFASLNKELS